MNFGCYGITHGIVARLTGRIAERQLTNLGGQLTLRGDLRRWILCNHGRGASRYKQHSKKEAVYKSQSPKASK
jgi:hypothetical protein